MGIQIFSAAAIATQHQLHEELHNALGTRRHIHTTSSEHFTTLREGFTKRTLCAFPLFR